MIPEEYKEVERMGVSEDGFPYVTFVNDLTFHGLVQGSRQDMVGQILQDVRSRHLARRPHIQHAHYVYRPGDVVVEIGAFLGFYAMWVVLQVGPTGCVVAIEMIPECCEVLRANLAPFPNAVVIEKGVGSYCGKGVAYVGQKQTSGMREDVVSQFNDTVLQVEVEMDTADSILSEYDSIDMMIVQVNGGELDVLEGMLATLPRVKNIAIASQYDEDGVNHLEVVSDILRSGGFEVVDDGVVVYGGR